MNEHVTVAAVAVATLPSAIEANLELIHAACRKAASEGAELVLLPELSATGFIPNHPPQDHATWLAESLAGAWRMAQPIDGPLVHGLAEISRSTGVFLAAGMLEHAGNVLHNTHVLVGEGKLHGAWRKLHVPLFEMPFYNGGGAAPVVDTPLGRIGVNICFDAFLPESTRLLGVQNAEIVLFPFAADPQPVTPEGWYHWAHPVLQARCAENGVFGVACNYLGEVIFAGVAQCFPGGAAILDPTGAAITAIETEIAVATLSRDALLEARSRFEYTFRFRRPALYGSLAG
ncbi:MAG: carbon-nitrogen hydrolase family protein [Bryobacterales bacterium]|nr:carbon-nitrogen hydrolase family protein [Bryobacterales bacterium]